VTENETIHYFEFVLSMCTRMLSDIKRKQFTQTEDWKISDRYNSLMERVNSANRDVDEKTIDIKTDLKRNLVRTSFTS
jgi:hypothetical protein